MILSMIHLFKTFDKYSFKMTQKHSNKHNFQNIKSSIKNVIKSISTYLLNYAIRAHDKQIHQLKIHKKIRQSTFINQMRMKIAKTKYQQFIILNAFRLCQQIFRQVLKRLANISQQKDSDYQLILINYIVQGCIQMFQDQIKVHVLEKDLDIVKNLLPDILKSFQYFVEQQIGQQFNLNLIIVQHDCLKSRSLIKQLDKNQQNSQAIGGVILSDTTGNIVFKNTFDARLNILKENAYPLIRQVLWGKNIHQTLNDTTQF